MTRPTLNETLSEGLGSLLTLNPLHTNSPQTLAAKVTNEILVDLHWCEIARRDQLEALRIIDSLELSPYEEHEKRKAELAAQLAPKGLEEISGPIDTANVLARLLARCETGMEGSLKRGELGKASQLALAAVKLARAYEVMSKAGKTQNESAA